MKFSINSAYSALSIQNGAPLIARFSKKYFVLDAPL